MSKVIEELRALTHQAKQEAKKFDKGTCINPTYFFFKKVKAEHKFTPWTKSSVTDVFGHPKTEFPLYREQGYQRVCTLCGHPQHMKVRI